MIETFELSKQFDIFLAVDRVTLRVPAGQVLALLGPNGAGKTTTVRMLTSILRPSTGQARVAGYDVVAQAAQVRASVGVLTEHHGLYNRMRALEYLDFFGQLHGLGRRHRRKRAKELLDRFGLREAIGKRVGEYSKGMKQKLALVRAMLHDPPALLLDEPTSAMDPLSARLVRDSIVDLRSEARAIILTTHNLSEAELLADRIAILRQGRVIAEGTPDELKARLLGAPLLELRLAAPVDGLHRDLADLIEVTEWGPDWLRYRTPDPRATNPRLLNRLVGLGMPVITLAEVPRGLEDVYLQVVGERQATTPMGDLA